MTNATNHLDQWLADEQALRDGAAQGAGPGVARREQVANMSGLELMQAMLRGELPSAPIAQTLDFILVEVGPGRAVFQGTPGPQLLNPWAPCTAAGSPPCSIPRSAAPCTP